MIKKSLLSITVFAVIGLIAGYAILGKWAGEYVSLKTLFSFGGHGFQSALRSISGIDDIRNKILLCGAAGAVVGLLLSFKLKK
jgi:hypothetical protein